MVESEYTKRGKRKRNYLKMDKERALSNKELGKHGKNLGESENGDKMKEQEESSRKKRVRDWE